jgi:hypothetical protein
MNSSRTFVSFHSSPSYGFATIVTGMQLWNKPDLRRFDIYLRFLSLFFDNALRARLVAGYWSTDPKRFLFHRRQSF